MPDSGEPVLIGRKGLASANLRGNDPAANLSDWFCRESLRKSLYVSYMQSADPGFFVSLSPLQSSFLVLVGRLFRVISWVFLSSCFLAPIPFDSRLQVSVFYIYYVLYIDRPDLRLLPFPTPASAWCC